MSVIQAILVGLLGIFSVNRVPWFFGPAGGFFGIGQPLVACTIMGAIFGDVKLGLEVGAVIQSLYLGVIQPGGALPSDKGFATFIGGSLAIATGGGAEMAVALAVPLGLLGVGLFQGFMTFNTVFVRKAIKSIEEGDGTGIKKANIEGAIVSSVFYFILYSVINYFGVGPVQSLMEVIPQTIFTVLSIVAKLVPAVGFAMLLKYIINDDNKWMIFFFIMGFVLVANTQFNIISLVLFAIGISVIFVVPKYQMLKENSGKNVEYIDMDDEGDEYEE